MPLSVVQETVKFLLTTNNCKLKRVKFYECTQIFHYVKHILLTKAGFENHGRQKEIQHDGDCL